MFDNRYRLVARAGSGGFADVWRAEDTLRNDRVVALKIYTRLDDDGIKQMSLEYNETEYIQHPNLLTGNHFAAVGNIPYMEMRYCDGGSLAKRVGSMDSGEIRNVLHDVLSGLAYLHLQGIVHQDIKPENILHDSTHNVYMLADFGISGKSRTRLSKSVQRDSNSVSMTLAYAPPEKFSSNPVDREPSTKGDIFSLGVTLYELVTGTLPFEQPVNTGERMLNCEGNVKVYFDNIADPTLRQMAQRCIQYRKENRPTAEELLTMLDGKTEPQPEPHQSGGNNTVHLNDTSVTEQHNSAPKNKPDSKWLYIAIAAVAILVAVVHFSRKPKPEPVIIDMVADSTIVDTELQEREELSRQQQELEHQRQQQARQQQELEQQRQQQARQQQELERQRQQQEPHRYTQQELSEIYNKGVKYYNAKQYGLAAEQYRIAAEQGYAKAQCELGYLYDNGWGVPQDWTEAVKWYRLSANQGNKYAQDNLGLMYENGRGVTQDYAEAMRWYRKAADQGHANAQNHIGNLYYNGKGVTKDYYEAVRWYQKAAAQGNMYSQYNLGWCYQYGQGVTADPDEARRWYQKAADQGYETAKKQLRSLEPSVEGWG